MVTFMFEPLPGSEATVLRQMFVEVERFHRSLLTRVVRKPRSAKGMSKAPRLFAFPDRPVFKHQKQALEAVVVNDGLHLHAVVLVPRQSRLGTGLKKHVRENERLYLGNHGKLRRVDVQRLKPGTEAKVVDYSAKTWRRGRMSMDDVLVLPRSASEL